MGNWLVREPERAEGTPALPAITTGSALMGEKDGEGGGGEGAPGG